MLDQGGIIMCIQTSIVAVAAAFDDAVKSAKSLVVIDYSTTVSSYLMSQLLSFDIFRLSS